MTHCSQSTQQLGVAEDDDGERHDEAGDHEEVYVAGRVVLLIVSVPVGSTGAAQTFRDVPTNTDSQLTCAGHTRPESPDAYSTCSSQRKVGRHS